MADKDGLIGFGGELNTEWLLDAYANGIFPWPISNENEPIAWWSLDPRAIFDLDAFYISKRLRRTIRSGKFTITCNQTFKSVMEHCAEGPGRQGGTWINSPMIAAYTELHNQGHAHSVETWFDNKLAGGVYGVSIGGLFAAESMFTRVTDASKAALAYLVAHLKQCDFTLLDIQQLTDHTASLGAIEITRKEYLERLTKAIKHPAIFKTEISSDLKRSL